MSQDDFTDSDSLMATRNEAQPAHTRLHLAQRAKALRSVRRRPIIGRTCRRPSSSRSRSGSAPEHERDWPGAGTPAPRRQRERTEQAFASLRVGQILWWNFGSSADALRRSCAPAATNAQSWIDAWKRGPRGDAVPGSRAPAARSRAPRRRPGPRRQSAAFRCRGRSASSS